MSAATPVIALPANGVTTGAVQATSSTARFYVKTVARAGVIRIIRMMDDGDWIRVPDVQFQLDQNGAIYYDLAGVNVGEYLNVLFDGAQSLPQGAVATVTSITSTIQNITLPLSVANGGTGATNANSARADLGAATAGSNTATGTASITGSLNVRHERVTAPPAADTTSIVAQVNAAASGSLTIAAQPAWPCKLQIALVDANSSVTGQIAVSGISADGQTITNEYVTITAQGTHTYTTVNAYATVSAIYENLTGVNVGTDKISVGQSSALGLPYPAGSTSLVVFKENVDGANETVGTADATAGTITPTTAPNGAHNYDFWYSFTGPAPTDAGHVHAQN